MKLSKYEKRRVKSVLPYPVKESANPYQTVQAIHKGINPETGKTVFMFKKINHPGISFFNQ